MTRERLCWGLFGLGLCASSGFLACSPSATGGFDDKGYQHAIYDYRVDATHPADAAIPDENLLGNDWKIDNFYRTGHKGVAPKETDGYLTKYGFDINDDGKIDFEKDDYLYDLRFKHLQRDAVIWLRTVPLSDELRNKELRVLVQRYVDEVSGAGFEAVKLDPTTTLLREKRFGASVISRARLKLAEQEAYETTFDVANVDELAINPNARRTRVRIVLVRTPFIYATRGAHSGKHEFGVLMLLGYANLPEDFATDEKAFELLLDHTVIGGKRGATALTPEALPNAAPEAKPSEATPPVSSEPSSPEASLAK